jgi:hypothetical protein
MKQAERNLRRGKQWQPNNPREPLLRNYDKTDYDLFLHNCQSFTDALRDEYERLGGETCSTPFVNGACQK